MEFYKQFIAILLLCLTSLSLCADQDVLTILRQHSDLSSFTTYLQQFPDIVDVLNNGTFTVLAPDNNAIAGFLANNSDIAADATAIRALLQYHCVNETHPSAGFGLKPLFPATLLSNKQFANVTGGQRVELTLEDGVPTILSGVKARSKVTQPDIFFIGGLIQTVSTVLTIPISFPATITAAGLTNLVAILNKGGFLTPSSPAAEIVNSIPDLTAFAPDNPAFGPSFTGFDTLSDEALQQVFNYSFVPGKVVYSSDLKNQSQFTTLASLPITITELNGKVYADAAEITITDYITSNGVLQVLDSPLNPNATDARPAVIANTDLPDGKSRGLSAAAAAGLGIGIGSLVVGGAVTLGLLARGRKRRGLKIFGNAGRRHRLPEENMIPEQRWGEGRGGSGMGGSRGSYFNDALGRMSSGMGRGAGGPNGSVSGSAATYDPYGGTQSGGGRETMSGIRSPPPPFEAHELDNKAFPSPGGSPPNDVGNGRATMMTTTTTRVVEIHTPTSRKTSSDGHRPLPPGRTHSQTTEKSGRTSSKTGSALSGSQRSRNYSSSGRLNSSNMGSQRGFQQQQQQQQQSQQGHEQQQQLGLDGFPLSNNITGPLPSPIIHEVDGMERGRISISITGEAPRHLGFQARY